MRFDLPLLSHALCGSAALAAFIPAPPHPRQDATRNPNLVERIQGEIAHLERLLDEELHQLQDMQHHRPHGPPFSYAPSPATTPTPAPSSYHSSIPAASSLSSASVDAQSTTLSSSAALSSTQSVVIPTTSLVDALSTSTSSSTLASSSTSSSDNLTSPASTSLISSSAAAATTPVASTSLLAVSLNDTLCSLTAAYSSAATILPSTTAANASISSLLAAASSYVATASVYQSTDSSTSALATSTVSVSPVPSVNATLSASSSTAADVSSGSLNTSTTVTASTAAIASVASTVTLNTSTTVFASTAALTSVASTVTLNASTTVFASTAISSSIVSVSPVSSANSTVVPSLSTGLSVSAAAAPSSAPFFSANATSSAFLTGTASMAPASPTVSASTTGSAHCSNLCNSLSFSNNAHTVTPVSCQAYTANDTITITGGQAAVKCGTTVQPELDICRVTLNITTSAASTTYMEVWLPNGNETAWNGRTMSTDNGGLNGCVHYVDMNYVAGLGFAAIGDNGGHNSGAFDGSWMLNNNEEILDWAYRARHESVQAGKQVVDQFYGQQADKSYYIGCSTGGQQGLHSAQYFPDDFDGIIAGSAAADFEHLEDWSSRFVQLTGTGTDDPRFLTEDQWITVQSYIFDQCDEALDGVNDGILEDPTICQFNASVMACTANATSNCLTDTQVNTVEQVFTELYDTEGQLLYPQLLYGSQVDAFRLGQLAGTVQGIAHDWFANGVYNDSSFDALNVNQSDYARADALDAYHGNVSSFNGDLSAFQASGHKLLMYHGMADPLVSGANSQRYYLKVAKTLGLDHTNLDDFFRFFRISGMAHCGVGGISGAGAWMFGQAGQAAVPGVADNIVWNLVDWVEKGQAPDTLTGTKFWYDEPELGIQLTRPHCRFPYRTTFNGGDSTSAGSWGCEFIPDWQECGVGAHPRLCNVDGSFT